MRGKLEKKINKKIKKITIKRKMIKLDTIKKIK